MGGLERERKDSELNPDPNPNRTQAQRKINSRSQLYLSGSKGFSTHFRIYQAKKKQKTSDEVSRLMEGKKTAHETKKIAKLNDHSEEKVKTVKLRTKKGCQVEDKSTPS